MQHTFYVSVYPSPYSEWEGVNPPIKTCTHKGQFKKGYTVH